MEDLTVLLVAVVSFSLFFASLAAAYASREARSRGDQLASLAGDLLEAVMTNPRWTLERGLFLAVELAGTSGEDVPWLPGSQDSIVVVWNLETDERWRFGGEGEGDRRTAATSANVVRTRVDPARVVVTVWGP